LKSIRGLSIKTSGKIPFLRPPLMRDMRSIVVFNDDLKGQPVYRAVDEFLRPE